MEELINIILVTHNDLDGVFAAALAKLAFPHTRNYNLIIHYCGYADVNQKVKQILEDVIPTLQGTTKVFITDISVKQDVAEMIDNYKLDTEFCLLDHHGNAEVLALNKYKWANVQVYMGQEEIDPNSGLFHSSGTITNKKTSGTRMFYDALKDELAKELDAIQMKNLLKYVELVRKYDTWEWATSNDNTPNLLNTLFKLYPRKMFVNTFGESTRYLSSETFNEVEQLMISLDEEKKLSYIKSKLKEVHYMTVGGKCAAIVMAEQYINDLAHEVCVAYPKAELAIVANSKSLSFRTDKEVDVSEVAQIFGGNGHPKASGAQISEDIRFDMLSDLIFMLEKDKETE